jgi:hypothetical protein
MTVDADTLPSLSFDSVSALRLIGAAELRHEIQRFAIVHHRQDHLTLQYFQMMLPRVDVQTSSEVPPVARTPHV